MAYILAICSLASCNNEDAPTSVSQAEQNPDEFLNITYEGELYRNIPTTYDKNGEFVFLDDEFAKIYEENLKGSTTLSIHLIDESSIEMFKTLEDNLLAHGIDPITIPVEEGASTRTGVSSEENFLGTVDLWDDKGFKDTHWQFGILTASNPKWF